MLLADLSTGDAPLINAADGEIRVPVAGAHVSVVALRRLDRERLPVTAVELQAPSLDDVFLHLTGGPARCEPLEEVTTR
jgi:hypothetical protein